MGLVLLPFALIASFLGIFLAAVATFQRTARPARAAVAAFGAAWVFQLGAIVHIGMERRHFPLTDMQEYLLVLSWLILTFHLIVWFRARIEATAVILPPVSALLGLLALVGLATQVPIPAEQQDAWFIFHTAISTLGIAALGVAFAMSVIYLLQDRALKSKRKLRILEKLPSLEASDRIGYHAVLWGFPLLTVGVATGLVWAYQKYHGHVPFGPKEIFAFLAWTVFASLLYARVVRGFRGRKSAYVTIAGFALGLLVVLGMTTR